MRLLKPCGRVRGIPPRLHETVEVLAESGLGQYALDLFPGDSLQDCPRVVREVPQHGIELPPYVVARVIPRRTHVQGELCQGVEPGCARGRSTLLRISGRAWPAHDPSFNASPTMPCASSRIRRR